MKATDHQRKPNAHLVIIQSMLIQMECFNYGRGGKMKGNCTHSHCKTVVVVSERVLNVMNPLAVHVAINISMNNQYKPLCTVCEHICNTCMRRKRKQQHQKQTQTMEQTCIPFFLEKTTPTTAPTTPPTIPPTPPTTPPTTAPQPRPPTVTVTVMMR